MHKPDRACRFHPWLCCVQPPAAGLHAAASTSGDCRQPAAAAGLQPTAAIAKPATPFAAAALTM